MSAAPRKDYVAQATGNPSLVRPVLGHRAGPSVVSRLGCQKDLVAECGGHEVLLFVQLRGSTQKE